MALLDDQKPACWVSTAEGAAIASRGEDSKLQADYLANEHHKIIAIEGRVDLQQAATVVRQERGDEFPAACHHWMRYSKAPPDEYGDNWREVCAMDASGAKPVTVSIWDW